MVWQVWQSRIISNATSSMRCLSCALLSLLWQRFFEDRSYISYNSRPLACSPSFPSIRLLQGNDYPARDHTGQSLTSGCAQGACSYRWMQVAVTSVTYGLGVLRSAHAFFTLLMLRQLEPRFWCPRRWQELKTEGAQIPGSSGGRELPDDLGQHHWDIEISCHFVLGKEKIGCFVNWRSFQLNVGAKFPLVIWA